MASSSPLELNARCHSWLNGIDTQTAEEEELAELKSTPTPSQFNDTSQEGSVALSFVTMLTAVTNDWGAKEMPYNTQLCVGLVVHIPQWSYVQDATQRKFALYHLTCRRGNITWEVRKRFSDFVTLHGQLQHQYRLAWFLKTRSKGKPLSHNTKHCRFSTEPLPALPSRRLWPPTNNDVDAVFSRCLGLQTYLHQLLQLPRPTQPYSPLNRFLVESTTSYVRVLSTSHIASPTGSDHHRSNASPLMGPSELPDGFPDFTVRLMKDPSKAMIRIDYPEWVQHEEFWDQEYHTDFDKMQLVIDISRKNVTFGTGGPFGAAIFNRATNRVVSVGMSLVEHGNNCCLHAEMVAVQMATTLLRTHTLDRDPAVMHELFSSSEPCAMCIGATLWCGVQRLVCAATDVDVRSLLHDTGPVFEESFRYLQSKGIQIKRKFLRSEAKQVLCEYSAVRTSVMGRQV